MSSSAVTLVARLRGGASHASNVPEPVESFLFKTFNQRNINLISLGYDQSDNQASVTVRCSDSDEILSVLAYINSDPTAPCSLKLLPSPSTEEPVPVDSCTLIVRRDARSAAETDASLLYAILEPYGIISAMDTVGSISTVTFTSKDAALKAYGALKGRMFFGAPLEVSLEGHIKSEPMHMSSESNFGVISSEVGRSPLAHLDVSASVVVKDGSSSASGTPNKSSPRLSERRGVQALSLSTFALEKPAETIQDVDDFSRIRSGLSSLTMNENESDVHSPNWSSLNKESESQFWFAGAETASGDFSNHQLISPSSVSAEWTHWSSEEPPGSRSVLRESAVPGPGPGHSALVSDLIASFGPGSHRGYAEIGNQSHLSTNRDKPGRHPEYSQQQQLQRHQYSHQTQQSPRGPVMPESNYGVLSTHSQQSLVDLESVTSHGSGGSTWSARHDGSVSSGSTATRDVYLHSEPALNYSFGLYSDLSPKSQYQRSGVDSFHESNVKRVQYYPSIPSPKSSSVPSPSTNTALRITSAPYVPSSPVKAQGGVFFPGPAGGAQHSAAESLEVPSAAGSYRSDNNASRGRISSYPYAESETDSDTTGSQGSKPVGEYSIHSGQYEPDIRNVFVGNIGRLSSDGVQQLIKYFANLGVAVLKVDIKISFAFLEVRDTPDLQERIESIALGSGGHPPPFGRDGRLLRIEFVQQSSAGKQNIKMRRENMMQPTCSLFVVGFDHRRTSASTLASLFGKFGTVEHVEVKNNYAFVKFFNLNDSIAAQKAMHGFVWHDRTLSVEFSNRKSLGTLGMALLQHQQLHGLSGRPPIMPVHHLQERGGPAFNAPNAHHLPAPMHRSAPPHHSLQQQQASFAPSQHYSSSRPGLEHGNSGAPIAPVNSYDSSSMWTPAQGPTGVPATRPKVEFSAAPPPVNYLYSSGNPADARQRSIPAGSSSMNMPHGSRNAAVEHSFGTNFNNNFYSNAKADERAPKLYVMGGVQQRGYDSGATMAQPLHFQSRNAPSYQQARPADRNPSPRPEFNAGATYNTRAQIFDASPEDSLGSYTDHVYAEQGFRPAGGRTAGLPKHHQPYQFAHLEDHHQRNQPAFDVSGGASISSLGSNGSDGSRSHLSMPLQSGADVFTPGISTALNAPRQSFMPQSHQIPSSSYDIESDSQHYSSLNTAPLSLQEPFAGMMVASNRSNAGLSSHAVDMSQSSRPKGIYSSTNSASGGASSPGSSGPSPFVFSAQSFPVSPILSGENAEQKSFFYDVPVEAP